MTATEMHKLALSHEKTSSECIEHIEESIKKFAQLGTLQYTAELSGLDPERIIDVIKHFVDREFKVTPVGTILHIKW